MKKSILFILTLILSITPCFFLEACGSLPSYLITALPSDSTLGRVEGVNNKIEQQEGTRITLKAVANSTSNPFLCWIKDYSEIVSNEEEFELTYNKNTAGNYTAVFEEDVSKMLFASLKEIEIDTSSDISDAPFLEVNIEYARMDTGSTNYFPFLTYSSNQPNNLITLTSNKVLFFGGIGKDYQYNLKASFVLQNGETGITTYSVTFNNLLNKNCFEDGYSYSLQGSFAVSQNQTKDFTITFEKLTKDNVSKLFQ